MDSPTPTSATKFELSPGQIEAKKLVQEWLNNWAEHQMDDLPPEIKVPPNFFKFQGYAGTGKTSTIKSLLEEFEGGVSFAAFTGKAALVMTKQGLPAGTIHSLIYKPVEPDKQRCEDLFKKIRETGSDGEKRRLQKELDETRKVTFKLKEDHESDLSKSDLLVLDEVSMVGPEMGRDLESFGVPILAIGDPGQLPPIEGTGYFVQGKPDALLTEIHRQAKDNPIIDLATRARSGIPIPYGTFGGSIVLPKITLKDKTLGDADQILTGKNITRQDLNRRVRALRGFSGVYPQVGEKVICLRNNKELMIFNGQMAKVVSVGEHYDYSFEMELELEPDHKGETRKVKVFALKAHFDAYEDKTALNNVKWWMQKDSHEFDFGYAITVHKSQGSQWDDVLIYDDGMFVWEPPVRRRWLYTAITRAAKNVAIVK